jgi:hypothetical protein
LESTAGTSQLPPYLAEVPLLLVHGARKIGPPQHQCRRRPLVSPHFGYTSNRLVWESCSLNLLPHHLSWFASTAISAQRRGQHIQRIQTLAPSALA